jgi:hypothetical protein
MIRARQHPCSRYGWIFCEPQHYQAAFDEQQRLVTAATAVDRHFSGEPAAMEPWAEQQLREVASLPFYQRQFQGQVDMLQQQADAVVRELERRAADLAAKVDALQAERQHLLSFLADE